MGLVLPDIEYGRVQTLGNYKQLPQVLHSTGTRATRHTYSQSLVYRLEPHVLEAVAHSLFTLLVSWATT